MRAFECSGTKGTYLELADGRYADTVEGGTTEDMSAESALTVLRADVDDYWTRPLFSGWTLAQVEVYVGARE